jgi:flagellar basal body rod protein FlgC
MSSSLRIALSGLADATLRAVNAAENIVKASSTIRNSEKNTPAAQAEAPTDVVTVSQNIAGNNLGVTSGRITRDPAYVTRYDGTSSLADDHGLVAVPNVDIASEIVALNVASIAYQANAKVIEVTRKTDEELLRVT